MTAKSPAAEPLAVRFLAETVMFAGFPMRRGDVYAMMVEDGHPGVQAGRFAFQSISIDDAPMSIAAVRAAIAEALGDAA